MPLAFLIAISLARQLLSTLHSSTAPHRGSPVAREAALDNEDQRYRSDLRPEESPFSEAVGI
jgi:hypothetical protein